MFFDPTYYLYAIPGIILLFIAQILVKFRFSKYSKVGNAKGITGRIAAEQVLRDNGVTGVLVERCRGSMTDHYDPRTNTIRLSETVYDSTSVAAVGVAAHEAGHAVQYANNYAPIKLRMKIVPVCNFGSSLGPILAVVGFMLSANYEGNLGYYLSLFGIILFASVLVFQIITLPVEFDASRRAIQALEEGILHDDREVAGAKKVLTAAAMTYVASMFQSLLILLYYVTRLSGSRRNN